MINMNTILIAHDDSVCIVYCPEKGSIKTTTPDHAKDLLLVYKDYVDKKLSKEECQEFERYLDKNFINKEDLPCRKAPNLLEREALGRLEIMLANDCNLKCKYCYADGGNYGKKPMRMQSNDVVKYLDSLLVGRYNKVSVVMLFGGEPTISPEAIKTVCEYFSEKVSRGIFITMPIFTMVTNGTLIDEFLVDVIRKYNIKVTVSVDGPEEINDFLRVDGNGKGTFAKIEKGIRLMQNAGCPPRMLEVTYTSMHKRMGYEKESIRMYLKNHFDVEKIMIANCSPTDKGTGLEYHNDSDMEISDGTSAVAKGLSQKYFSDVSCDAGLNSCALMPSGELYPCHFFVNNNSFRIATFSREVFDFENYSDVLSRMSQAYKSKNTNCEKCWAKALCRACPAGILLYGEDLRFCEFERERLKKHLLVVAKSKRS